MRMRRNILSFVSVLLLAAGASAIPVTAGVGLQDGDKDSFAQYATINFADRKQLRSENKLLMGCDGYLVADTITGVEYLSFR